MFVGTSPWLKAVSRRSRRSRCPGRPVHKAVHLPCERCLSCNSRKLYQTGGITQLVIEVKSFRDGVKRRVTRYVSRRYSRTACGTVFTHPDFLLTPPARGATHGRP
jgi:hypothetical protein